MKPTLVRSDPAHLNSTPDFRKSEIFLNWKMFGKKPGWRFCWRQNLLYFIFRCFCCTWFVGLCPAHFLLLPRVREAPPPGRQWHLSDRSILGSSPWRRSSLWTEKIMFLFLFFCFRWRGGGACQPAAVSAGRHCSAPDNTASRPPVPPGWCPSNGGHV